MVQLTVYGHARPSVRITKATKWTEPAKAYLAWQKHVAETAKEQLHELPLPWEHFRVDMLFFFCDDDHGDRINLGKSTEDGLAWADVFPRRRLKSGRLSKKADDSRIHDGNVGVRYCDLNHKERVEITLSEFIHPHKKGA